MDFKSFMNTCGQKADVTNERAGIEIGECHYGFQIIYEYG